MKVYDVDKMGQRNTAMRTVGVWPVEIISVDAEKGTVVAKWNGNDPKTYSSSDFKKWRLKEPVLVKVSWCSYRLATREELKALKEKA